MGVTGTNHASSSGALPLSAGPQGIQGPRGIQGAPGAAGPPGPTQVTYVHSPLIPAPVGKSTPGVVSCPSGQVVTGGGVEQVAKETNVTVNSSLPIKWPQGSPYPNTWLAWVNNPAGGYSYSFIVYAICVTPTKVDSF